jgi:hypothetical protein
MPRRYCQQLVISFLSRELPSSFTSWVPSFAKGLLCLAVTMAVLPALAAEYTLTTLENVNGKPLIQQVPNYDQIVDSLVPGDVIIFSDGKKIELQEFLGNGNTNRIFAVTEDKVIRIPRVLDGLKISYTTSAIPNITLKGYEPIKKLNVQAVKVFEELSRPGEYVIAERVQSRFDLTWYNQNRGKISREERTKLDNELLDFSRSTSEFIRIGDFHPGQVVYMQGRGWLLLDWTDLHMLRADHPQYNRTIYDRVYLPDQRDLVLTPEIPMPMLLKWKAKRAIKHQRSSPAAPVCSEIFG